MLGCGMNHRQAWMLVYAPNQTFRMDDALAATKRDEVARPPRENKRLRVERHILSRAAAWFARDTGAAAETRSACG